jgi:hypothetical protein
MSKIPEYLSLDGNHAEYRPVGSCTFEEAVEMIDGALSYCKENRIGVLLVSVKGLSGFPPPTTAQRFRFATQWSATAAGSVRLALLSPPELIDTECIGVTMANNRGLDTQVFDSESEARRWMNGDDSATGACD